MPAGGAVPQGISDSDPALSPSRPAFVQGTPGRKLSLTERVVHVYVFSGRTVDSSLSARTKDSNFADTVAFAFRGDHVYAAPRLKNARPTVCVPDGVYSAVIIRLSGSLDAALRPDLRRPGGSLRAGNGTLRDQGSKAP